MQALVNLLLCNGYMIFNVTFLFQNFFPLLSTYHINWYQLFKFYDFFFSLYFVILLLRCRNSQTDITKGMCDLFMSTHFFCFHLNFQRKHIFMVSFITNAEFKWFYLLTMDITITNNTSEMCGMTNGRVKLEMRRWITIQQKKEKNCSIKNSNF